MSHRAICSATLAALLLSGSMLSAADAPYGWAEGEAPAATPAILTQADFPKDGVQLNASWGHHERMSQDHVLHLTLNEEQVAKAVPADGLTFAYELKSAGGKQELWARIGYEWARSALRWRTGAGTWNDVAPDQPTTDVVLIQTWNELGWVKLGTIDAPAGTARIELNWPKTTRTDKGQEKTNRILGMLDALCLAAPGAFAPSGTWQPGQDHRTPAETAAAQQVFALPEGTPGTRTSVALTGAWEMANWDEDVREPTDRLGPVEALPALDQQRWFAYQVPNDRNHVRPDFAAHHRFIARCRVAVPASLQGRSFLLDIQRFGTIATVFVNGKQCGYSKAHSTAWQLDLSAAIKPGASNEIAVVFKDRYYALNMANEKNGWRGCWNWPAEFLSTNQGVCSHYEMAVAADDTVGFTEPVALIAAGPAYAADVFVKTSVARHELALEVTLTNPGAARTVTLGCAAVPWTKTGTEKPAKTLKPLNVQLAAGETKRVDLSESWPDPQLWWPDDVHLYDLVTTISTDGKPLDISRTRFGFREWTWDSHVFKLNGSKWQAWADLEYNWKPEEFVANRAKTGCNLVRLWSNGGMGTMTRREALDYFDEHGVLVRESGTFDGEAANYGGGLCEEVTIDGKKTRRAKQILFDNWKTQLAAWVKAERNHASIFVWSAENEVTYINSLNLGMKDLVEPAIGDAVLNTVMKLDPTRPAMVDGGNALQAESLPVNGGHYTEDYNTAWRDFPDSCYTRDHWYLTEHKSRNTWRYVPDRPIFQGEVFFAEGYGTEKLATIGGERCFIGTGETRAARGRLGRIFSEGWRWGEVAAWQMWLGGGDFDYRSGWQPVAVLCRQWNTSFGPNQQVARGLKVFNNTSSSAPITAAWELQLAGKRVAGESKQFALASGVDAEWPVTFTVPAVSTATTGRFILTASRGGKEVFREERDIRVLAPATIAKPELKANELAVYDPQGSAVAFLTARGIPHTRTANLDEIPATAKLLVLGADAIPAARAGDPLWYSRAIAGLKVLVLDQRHPLCYRALPADLEPLDAAPTVWAQMQAKAANVEPELRGRYGFAEDLTHPALAGLTQADFFTWGGDHVLYRNPYRKGTRGFRSLVQCEEGLTCTALAECQTGDGLLLLSQLDIGEKLANEAVAQQMFLQLLDYAAAYTPLRREVSATVAADGQLAKALAGIGVRHQLTADPLAAIAKDGIALVDATPSNLATLAGREQAVRDWCAKGNWLMLAGVTPDGLADFNRLVQWQHVLRPFSSERVLMAVPADPLTAGLTLRDVVLNTGKNMYPWMALKKPDSDEFSWIVDHTDIAPFCTFPSPTALGKSSDTDPGADHWPRNMVNGFTSDDNWSFCYTVNLDQGHARKWTLTLPHEDLVCALKIRPSRIYHPITRVNLYFDQDPVPVSLDLRVDPVDQEVAFPARKAKQVTMEIAQWAERGTANIVVVDNLWLMVQRPPEYLARVKPLLNVGGLMRYDFGKGGIVLNQLKWLEREENPVNSDKKRTVLKGLLANLGAVFAAERTVVVGNQLDYHPVAIPDQRFNAYVRSDRQPGWWQGPGDFSGLPVGEQTFAGVRFKLADFTTSPVPSAFMLRGNGATVKDDKIEGIALNAKADALFFLHTANGSQRALAEWEKQTRQRRERHEAVEPPLILTYRVRYSDGSAEEVPVRWGQEIGSWLAKDPQGLPNASVAWTGKLAGAKDGEQATAWLMQWTNPHPDLAIASVDLIAGDAKWASAAVFAITGATTRK